MQCTSISNAICFFHIKSDGDARTKINKLNNDSGSTIPKKLDLGSPKGHKQHFLLKAWSDWGMEDSKP